MESTIYTPTPEQVSELVSGTYDCFNLISELKSKENLTEEEGDILERAEQHIRIMMGKEWFVAGLTDKQITELQAI